MACNCENIICLEAKFDPCSSGVMLDVISDETADWTAEIEFNGIWNEFEFGVIEGEYIVIPTSFLNEQYDHQFRLYNSEDELVDCYTLRARSMSSAGVITPIAPGGTYEIFDVTIEESGNSVTDSRFGEGMVLLISANDQSYNREKFTQVGNEIVSSVLSFTEGQLITVILKMSSV